MKVSVNQNEKIRRGRTLDIINFASTDVRDGWGPYLSLILLEKHFSTGNIGNILALTSMVTILSAVPAGWAYRKCRFSALIFGIACLSIAISSLLVNFTNGYLTVAFLQAFSGAACAFVAPGISTFSARLAKGPSLAKRLGRNEAFNHGGNLTAGIVNARLITWLGPAAVSGVIMTGALVTLVATQFGFSASFSANEEKVLPKTDGIFSEKRSRSASSNSLPTFFLLGFVFFFQIINAALLLMKVQQISAVNSAAGSTFLGWGIVVAQVVSVPTAWWLGRVLSSGFKLSWWLVGCACVITRALLFLISKDLSFCFFVQLLDGSAGGFIAVAPISLFSLLNRRNGELPLGAGGIGFTMALASTVSFFGASRIAEAKGFEVYFRFAALSGLTLPLFCLAIWLTLPVWARVQPLGKQRAE